MQSGSKSGSTKCISWQDASIDPQRLRRGTGHRTRPIIPSMNKPNHVFNGVMMCGDCGRPLQLGASNQISPLLAYQSAYFVPSIAVPCDFEVTSKTFCPPHESLVDSSCME